MNILKMKFKKKIKYKALKLEKNSSIIIMINIQIF